MNNFLAGRRRYLFMGCLPKHSSEMKAAKVSVRRELVLRASHMIALTADFAAIPSLADPDGVNIACDDLLEDLWGEV